MGIKQTILKGKYCLQRYESDYKPFFYGFEDDKGMNSCSSPFSPIGETKEEGNFDEEQLDTNGTYVVEYTVTIKKMTKKEERAWQSK